MSNPNIIAFTERCADIPNVVAELIGEPITLKDGSEFGLIAMYFPLTDRHQVRAVRLGKDLEVQAYISEDEVLELGQGNFQVGVMEVAKMNLPGDLI